MEQLPGLPAAAFDKADPSLDAELYVEPRFVTTSMTAPRLSPAQRVAISAVTDTLHPRRWGQAHKWRRRRLDVHENRRRRNLYPDAVRSE
jgi:hypothetical protein